MKVLVVHATDVLARAWLSVSPGATTRDGLPTHALFGGARTLRRALAIRTPDVAVAVLDGEAPRPDWPEGLVRQLERWPALLEAHGLHLVTSSEPLRVVARYVHGCTRDDVVVVGSDKRLAQLVSDGVWWYEGHKDARFTPESIVKRYGVAPELVGDWLALVGEPDLVDGVPGIGRKGAVDLLERFGSLAAALAAALDDPEAVGGRAGRALASAPDVARRHGRAMDLRPASVEHVEVPVPLEAMVYTAPDPGSLNDAYRSLDLFGLLVVEEADGDRYVIAGDDLAARLAGLGSGPVAIEALTEDPSPVRGSLVALALSGRTGRAVTVPLVDGPVPAALCGWLEDAAVTKVGHDIKAAAVALARRGVTLRGIAGDTAIASHHLDSSGMAPHSLGRLAKAYLHQAIPDDTELRGRGARRPSWAEVMSTTPREAGAWLGQRADVAGQLWGALQPRLDARAMAEALALSEVLVAMELAGVPVDQARLDAAGAHLEARCADLEQQVHALAGRSFALGSTKQLGQVLFVELGLPVHHRTKTGWSTSAAALERLRPEHPIVDKVLVWRQLRTVCDTWVHALARHISADGRVHSTFHPARSFTGRLVNTEPDLGRVPGRTDDMARIRMAFLARPGWSMLSVDYDQLGLYVLAHLTGDPALVEPLRAGEDIHVATAAAVLERDPRDIDAEARQLGKVVNFATFAGQGSSSLALQLGVEPSEARRLIERFFLRYAVVREYLDAELEHARTHGYVTTLSGRRWPIHDLRSREQRERSYAERLAKRAAPEGSVADVTRRGLLRAARALAEAGLRAIPLVQIHDEVLFEVPEEELVETARIASEAMATAYDLRVPLRVGCKAGPSWGELDPLPDIRA